MYKTRKGEEETRILILKVERVKSQDIVHVCVVGKGFNGPSHMPFTEQAIEQSVTHLEKDFVSVQEFGEGYSIWKRAFENDDAGIYDVTVAEALSL